MREAPWLEMDISGVNVKLQIKGYVKPTQENWCDNWPLCSYRFSSNMFDFHCNDEAVLLAAEVNQLCSSLTDLLENKVSDIYELDFVEPNFAFRYFPKKDLRTDPRFVYVAPGHEIEDIYLEWKIFLWDTGCPTEHYVAVILYREEIQALRDYLLSVMELSKTE